MEKRILSFILKIMRNYLIAAFSNKCEMIYPLTCFSKVYHLHLDIITDILNEITSQLS